MLSASAYFYNYTIVKLYFKYNHITERLRTEKKTERIIKKEPMNIKPDKTDIFMFE